MNLNAQANTVPIATPVNPNNLTSNTEDVILIIASPYDPQRVCLKRPDAIIIAWYGNLQQNIHAATLNTTAKIGWV